MANDERLSQVFTAGSNKELYDRKVNMTKNLLQGFSKVDPQSVTPEAPTSDRVKARVQPPAFEKGENYSGF